MTSNSDDSPPSEAKPAKRGAFIIGAFGAAAKSAACSIAVQANVARHIAQKAVVNAGKLSIQALQAAHPKSNVSAQRGHLMEIWHKTTFNCDAVDRGSGYRAEIVPRQQAADIRIFDKNSPEQTLGNAQSKSSVDSTRLNKLLRAPKYDGMQKVVPAGMDDPARGTSSTLQYGGISSRPLSNQEAEAALSSGDPSKLLDPLAPNPVIAAGKAAANGAAVGAVVGAAVEVGQTLLQKGKMERGDLKRVGVAAAVGAGAGAVGGAVSIFAGSVPVGAFAASVTTTAHKMWQCGDRACALREAFVATAGSAAGLVATGAASVALTPVLAPVGLGWLAIPMAASVASGTVNKQVRQMAASRL